MSPMKTIPARSMMNTSSAIRSIVKELDLIICNGKNDI
jgi:hypothetical protein